MNPCGCVGCCPYGQPAPEGHSYRFLLEPQSPPLVAVAVAASGLASLSLWFWAHCMPEVRRCLASRVACSHADVRRRFLGACRFFSFYLFFFSFFFSLYFYLSLFFSFYLYLFFLSLSQASRPKRGSRVPRSIAGSLVPFLRFVCHCVLARCWAPSLPLVPDVSSRSLCLCLCISLSLIRCAGHECAPSPPREASPRRRFCIVCMWRQEHSTAALFRFRFSLPWPRFAEEPSPGREAKPEHSCSPPWAAATFCCLQPARNLSCGELAVMPRRVFCLCFAMAATFSRLGGACGRQAA